MLVCQIHWRQDPVPCEENQIMKIDIVVAGKPLLESSSETIKNISNVDVVVVDELAEYWRSREEST